jgi:histidyl-tRNA synthetase
MSTKLQPVRGTHDLLPNACAHYRHIVDSAREVAGRYGFAEIMTPIFEFSDVFHRTLGETSDVVAKETYTFEDRGGESITLRPELTAGIARAFIAGGLQDQLPCKFFCAGPAFRYERPQKGRMRQFHQIDVELLGAAEPQADVEVIACAAQVLEALGLKDQVTLELNSLGDSASRTAYRAALVAYFREHAASLSEDSKIRLEKNPLRILDSKDEGDRKLIAQAPQMHAHFTPEAKVFFAAVTDGLKALDIAFSLNDKLVRGLDYYSHTVFEFTTTALGAQGTVLAGGRYDGLIEMMGGASTPGIGFAAGIERLMALREQMNLAVGEMPKPVAVMPLGDATEMVALKLAHQLRQAGFVVEQAYRGNLGKRMKKADKLGCVAALILGEDELARGEVTCKDLQSGEQRAVKLADVEKELQQYRHPVAR